jgi:hypothetical protein
MADFAVWGVAIAKALGGDYEDNFLDAYYEILERQNVDAVEATLIGPALVRWYGEKPPTNKNNNGLLHQKESDCWEGTPETLLRILTELAPSFGIDIKSKEWPKKTHTFTRRLKPIIPDLRQAYKLDVIISRDTKGEYTTKNSTWIKIAKIGNNSSTSSTCSTDLNLRSAYDADSGCSNSGSSTNSKACSTTTVYNKVNCEDNNESNQNLSSSASGGDIERIGGALNKIAPPKDAQIDAQNNKGGASGRSGDILELSLASSGTAISQLDGRGYVAFDLEWKDNEIGNRTIYAAAFLDNHGNQKVLHISDFANSERALLRAITDEILKYPASIGWYTTGIARGLGGPSINQKGIGGGVSAAA